MINKQGLFLKQYLCLSRIIFLNYKSHKRIFFHTLPQKTFSQEIVSDVKQIEAIHRFMKPSNVNKHLFQCFEKSHNILDYIVNIIYCASERGSFPSLLVFSVVQQFSEYVESEKVLISPTLVQKTDILLATLKYKDFQLLQLVCNVFKINEQSRSFTEFVRNLILQQKYVEAALCTSVLQLQNEFDIKEILLPLLIEGHTGVASIYLANKPDLQLKTVKLLDTYLKFKDMNTIAVKPTEARKYLKILSSLLNTFKISTVHCPNLHFIKSKGAINILVNRRANQSVSEATWEDMLMNIIGENEDLKIYLIKKLLYKNDIKTARRMADRFNIDFSLFNEEVNNKIFKIVAENSIDDIASELGTNVDNEPSMGHLKFSLKIEDIKIVANENDFLNCIQDITQNYNIVGIDCEWKPNFGLSRDRLALIQLAVHDKVYILDVLSLSDCLKVEEWDKLLDDVFGNSNIIKLGCGIVTDVNMILESIQGTDGKTIKFSHILDMAIFYQKLKEVYPDTMIGKYDTSSMRVGLSSLCETILGRPLNKEERLCDWEKRPLKDSQLEYAALDAHCLIQMYDKLKEYSSQEKINFEHLSKVAVVLTTSQWKPRRRFKGVRIGKEFHIHSQISISKLKLIMDSTFENQGKELRRLGADVIILKSGDSADAAVQKSLVESRIIICSENLWHQVKNRVREGFCYHFPKTDNDQLKVSHLIQHFNVHVTTKSIFSRCMECNSDDGLKLNMEDLKKLHNLQATSHSASLNSAVKDILTSFTLEFQEIFNSILNSSLKIKFCCTSHSSFNNQCAFLCKKCGCIS